MTNTTQNRATIAALRKIAERLRFDALSDKDDAKIGDEVDAIVGDLEADELAALPTHEGLPMARCQRRAFGVQCELLDGHDGDHVHHAPPVNDDCNICGQSLVLHNGEDKFCPIYTTYRRAAQGDGGRR